jgi:DNA-binding transcriptional LysR family regulator
MDRLEAMNIFITALDEGSLAAAARKLRRSPAAISRAIAFLEAHVGAPLLHRTTRSMGFSEAGERYAVACRHMLAMLEEAETLARGEQAAPRGTLSISAPPISGEDVLRPILDDFLDDHPMVSARLVLLDRPVNLIEEGIDVAMRIAELPDSSLIATRVGTDVRRVVVGSPAYLSRYPPITKPADLAAHEIIAFTNFGIESWSFAAAAGHKIPRVVNFRPRLTVNTVRAALASAIRGRGLARLYSYHVAEAVRSGQLQVILPDMEHPPVPVHLLTPMGRSSAPKVRAFIDFATPRLRSVFSRLADEARRLAYARADRCLERNHQDAHRRIFH